MFCLFLINTYVFSDIKKKKEKEKELPRKEINCLAPHFAEIIFLYE